MKPEPFVLLLKILPDEKAFPFLEWHIHSR